MRRLLFATTALVPLGLASAGANPLNGQFSGGSGSISGSGTSNVVINQSSQHAVINWQSFNIGKGEQTQFIQNNSQSTVLNRVTGDVNASQIYGMLNGTGRVFLINPNGILIGNGAVINTAGFVATTHDISNADFMSQRYNFNIPGRPDASIVNLGTISAHSAGFAALVAPGVRNSGTITATFGKVGLASANGFTLDLYGDKLIQLNVNDQIAGSVRDVATGETLKSLVTNDGTIRANGGRVELSAVAARQVVDSVINTSGVIEARSIGQRAGKIVLGGATASTKGVGTATQTVKVSGKLSVASRKKGGGTVQIVGENIVIADAKIDASGRTGGGKVLIGGDLGGGKGNTAANNVSLENEAIANATTVTINGGTVIDASARSTGDGGKVIVWSDDTTSYSGQILARGGELWGNGGFAEVSGKSTLSYQGSADLRADHGSFGTLLLDPDDYTVGTVDAANSISSATLQSQLASANVLITNNPGAGNGDIFVAGNVSWAQNTTLTLSAYRNVQINDNVTISNTGAGNLVVRADNSGTGVGTLLWQQYTFGSRINWTGSTGKVSVYYNPTSSNYASPNDFTPSGQGGGTRGITVASASQYTAYMLVNTVANLASMRANPTQTYALGRDIDASSLVLSTGSNFSGILDGNGGLGVNYTISNLTMGAGLNPVGLFGFITPTGVVRNLNFLNVTINATSNLLFLGTVAGENQGTISNVKVLSGNLNGGMFTGLIAGGLVGQNRGIITGSLSAMNVTVGNGSSGGSTSFAGGLVGTNYGTITASAASGNVSGGDYTTIGGLVGQNGTMSDVNVASILLSSASGNVSSAGTGVTLGGLAGYNGRFGVIGNSSATGNVNSTGSAAGNNGNGFSNFINAGGLVGFNQGLVGSDSNLTFATGSVHVGSGGVGGGLIGFNDGFVFAAFATGQVTGAAGLVDSTRGLFGRATVLGGLVGTNQGVVAFSQASGNVGSAGTDRLLAGGFVGDNSGVITSSFATGNVTTGNLSQAGGFAGANTSEDCNGCNSQGIAFNTLATIVSSSASGNVTVGSSSIAGGFTGTNWIAIDDHAAGSVTGGGNSILGGFAGLNQYGGFIMQSSASGNVASTGANSWIGGFVGLNVGFIQDSIASGDVSGTSDSLIGGFAGVNVGWIDPSFAEGQVSASGNNNYLGGFVGVNFGLIDSATAKNLPTAQGTNNIIGGIAGGNARFTNIAAGLIQGSTFPTGTIINSTGQGKLVGKEFPTSLPQYPLFITGCDFTACEIFKNGILGGGTEQTTDNVDKQAASQLLQVSQQVFIPQIARDNSSPLPTLIALTTTTQSGGGGDGTGPSRTTSQYANATPGTAGFTPPPLAQRQGPDGLVPSGMPAIGETRFVQNQLLLRPSTGALNDAVLGILRQMGITVITTSQLGSLGGSVIQLQLPPGMTVRQAIARLEADPRVPALSTNSVFRLTQAAGTTKGDPAQYTLGKLQLEKTHQLATGKGVTIAVIDSEVDKRHTELKDAVAEELDTLTSKEPPHSHGTAMAGAIGSRDRLLGVAPGARIIAVRAFGESNNSAEGTSLSIIKGIEWAISQNARVVNMSFAGPRDPVLERALKTAYDRGLIMVAAAGNAGPKSPPLYPGADPHVIAVTATDVRDRGFRGANQGPQLSVAAPGVEILAPAPEANYQMSTGTSIATAHVSGVVALMLERNPRLKPGDVRRILEETATDLGTKGKDAQFGWGLVNPQKAIEAATALVKSSDASGARR